MATTLSTLLAFLILPVAVVWALPAISDLCSGVVRFALSRRRKEPADTHPRNRPRLLVLVPAHNESLLIGDCVSSLVGMRREHCDYDVWVVADNCSDDTASIARQHGATALERADLNRRGKPAAVQWVLDQISFEEYDAILIVDADSTVVPGFADSYALRGGLREQVYQGYYGLSNEQESWLSKLAGLLVRMRYEGQYLLKRSVGLNCPLTGNGMCIGTDVIARAGWANDSLTENWEMFARYTAAGEKIGFVPEARLAAHESGTLRESATRRRRWQAGRGLVFRTYALPILRSRGIGWRQKIDALAEISALGPVVQGAVAVAMVPLLMMLDVPAASVSAVLFAAALLHLAVWTFATWIRQPDRGALAVAFLRLPFYAAWRLAITVLAISTGRSGVWHRSPRQAQKAL